MRFTIPLLMRQTKSALRDPRNKFIPALPLKPATPPPPATTELPARQYETVDHLTQLRKRLIYGNTYYVLVVGEDNFSTSKRLAKEFSTGNLWAANFWAISEYPPGSSEVNTRGAREWIKLLTDAGASIGFNIQALSIATNDWVRGRNLNDAKSTVPLRFFDRVVFYQPQLDYPLLGCFLFKARRVLKHGGQVHLLSCPDNPEQPAKSAHLTWPLETLAIQNGPVCSVEIRISWGGEKHNRPWTLVVFTLPVGPGGSC